MMSTKQEEDGMTISAADWLAFFEERAAIAQHDGGLSRTDAERRAYECCVVRWLNSHPPLRPHADVCSGCGGRLGRIGIDGVPVLAGNGEHMWVHH